MQNLSNVILHCCTKKILFFICTKIKNKFLFFLLAANTLTLQNLLREKYVMKEVYDFLQKI